MSSLALLAAALITACGGGGAAATPSASPGTGSAATSVPAPVVLNEIAALNSAQELASANAAAWPFVQPPLATLRESQRKVFAHYFTPFPVSIDNKAAPADYYSRQYMSPDGEGGRYAGSGGYLKQRPMPRAVIGSPNWDQTDATQDVRRAASLGIDGFAVNLLASSGVHWTRAQRMLDIAWATDPGFKILLMPDMEAEFKTQPAKVLTVVRALASHPAAHRLPDGRLVLSPYNAQNQSAAWWAQLLASLRAEGIAVALFPVFQGWHVHAEAFGPISVGLSDWGDRSPSANQAWAAMPGKARAYAPLWMSPVSPQDARPKDLLYWEARNSENYRVMWESAINGGADWVHIVTWNDYSESTEVAPSSGTQWSFYDLTAYYTTWFKTGVRPAVTKDVLYYFHRRHVSSAAAGRQSHPYTRAAGSDAAADDIEVLAFVTAPATLRITSGTLVRDTAIGTGLSAVRVPLTEGTPVFELRRNDAIVTGVRSGFPISNQIPFQDMLYRSGSSARPLVAPQ